MDPPTGSPFWPYSLPGPLDGQPERLAPPMVLVVEDDADIREMLAILLDLAGYGSVRCETAEAGLVALREQEFDVILTDYALPGHTGVWMLDQADDEGLIDGVPALLVTAHPEPVGAAKYEVVEKPFDLDELVERMEQRMHEHPPPGRIAARGARAGSAPDGATGSNDGGECPGIVEVVLYINGPQPADVLERIRSKLSRYSPSKVRLVLRDISRAPAAGDADAAAVPNEADGTSQTPRTYILGHITSPELLLELLGGCDDEPPSTG